MRQALCVTSRLIFAACSLLLAAAPAPCATQTAQVSANFIKPLTLAWVQDMDLGSIVLGPGTWSGAKVAITRGGVFSCPATQLTCTGATKAATYNVQGSNQQVIRITAPDVTLVNQNDPTKTLLLTVDNPGSVMLTNSGFPGVNFSLGGSITLSSTTAAGVYTGTFNVTVDYQ